MHQLCQRKLKEASTEHSWMLSCEELLQQFHHQRTAASETSQSTRNVLFYRSVSSENRICQSASSPESRDALRKWSALRKQPERPHPWTFSIPAKLSPRARPTSRCVHTTNTINTDAMAFQYMVTRPVAGGKKSSCLQMTAAREMRPAEAISRTMSEEQRPPS